MRLKSPTSSWKITRNIKRTLIQCGDCGEREDENSREKVKVVSRPQTASAEWPVEVYYLCNV